MVVEGGLGKHISFGHLELLYNFVCMKSDQVEVCGVSNMKEVKDCKDFWID